MKQNDEIRKIEALESEALQAIFQGQKNKVIQIGRAHV